MPELPEVETARLLVERHCVGKKIVEVLALESGGGPRDGQFDDIVHQGPGSSDSSTASSLLGKTLVKTLRKGKVQIWKLSGGQDATIHFGMTGAWSVKGLNGSEYVRYSVNTKVWPPKFTKLELVFADGTRLAFTDPRRLARFRLSLDALNEPPVSELAPDALLELPPLDRFISSIRQKSTAIKALLLDQNAIVSGIGNWIIDEVLYQSAIHPETRCDAIDDKAMARLHQAIIDVIGFAVKVEAESDKFPKNWLFHYRWGKGKEDQKDAYGNTIKFETVGGRTSAVVAAIQGVAKKRPVEQKEGSTGDGNDGKGTKKEVAASASKDQKASNDGVPTVVSVSSKKKKTTKKDTADEIKKNAPDSSSPDLSSSSATLSKSHELFPHHRLQQEVNVPAIPTNRKRAREPVRDNSNKRGKQQKKL
jgi:formamidopyrimidine-DNA glycosylase